MQLVGFLSKQFLCVLIGLVDQFSYFLVDQSGRFFRIWFSKLILLSRIIETYVSYFFIHPVNRNHGIGDARYLLKIILGTGRNLIESKLFTRPTTEGHAYLIKKLICAIEILLLRSILCI